MFDFCQNMAGFTILDIPEGAATGQYRGLNVSILHAEAVHGPKPAPIFHHYGNTKEVNAYVVCACVRACVRAGCENANV